MPSYSILKADLATKVTELEGSGERVTCVVEDGPGAWVIITERTHGYRAEPGSVESR